MRCAKGANARAEKTAGWVFVPLKVPALILSIMAGGPRGGALTMPSRERLASINLHSPSLRVDKFSARAEFGRFVQLLQGGREPFLLAERLASKPSADRAQLQIVSRTFTNSVGKVGWKTEAGPPVFQQRGPRRRLERNQKGNTCSPSRACSCHAWRYDFKVISLELGLGYQ